MVSGQEEPRGGAACKSRLALARCTFWQTGSIYLRVQERSGSSLKKGREGSTATVSAPTRSFGKKCGDPASTLEPPGF